MKNTTTDYSTKTSTSSNRFNLLKTMFYQAPLSKNEFEELKLLAKKHDPKMHKYLEENRELVLPRS